MKIFVFFALCVFATSSTFLKAQYWLAKGGRRIELIEIKLWSMTASDLASISTGQMQNIVADCGDISPLLPEAVRRGNFPLVKVLLDNGANPRCNNQILFKVSKKQEDLLVPILIKMGADINSVLKDRSSNNRGLTAFSIAIVEGKKELLSLLYPFIDRLMLGNFLQAFGLAKYMHDEVTEKRLMEYGINENKIKSKYFPEYWKKRLFDN